MADSLRMVVIGGTGRVGRLICELLAQEGHQVRAVGRRMPSAIPWEPSPGVAFVRGDVTMDDPATWVACMEVVIFAAGGDSASERAVDHIAARRCAEVAADLGVARFVLVSAHGAHDPTSWGSEFQPYLEAKAAGEDGVRRAFPAATIVRPGILTDQPAAATATVRSGTGPGERPVSRADVAAIVAACASRDDASGRTLEVVGGSVPLMDALERALAEAGDRMGTWSG